jgi:AraC family transcriptional regulator of adaptative response/methylated-DNA-[protein]-cysteine methyltransferase
VYGLRRLCRSSKARWLRARGLPRAAGRTRSKTIRERARSRALHQAQVDRNLTLEASAARKFAHLQRVFTRVVGVSPRKYADTLRVDRLKRQLRSGDAIAGALYSSGYGSTSRLYEKAGAQLGMTPSAYRKRATGERIRFVTLESPIGGHILVAATERGICALRLGDRVRPLQDELTREFASARLEPGDDAMR